MTAKKSSRCLERRAAGPAEDRGNFDTWVAPGGGAVVISPSGELDFATRDALQVTVLTALGDHRVKSCIFDFRRVSFFDCAGLSCVILALHILRGRDGAVFVCNATPVAARVLTAFELDSVFAVFLDPCSNADSHGRSA
jgi:anti-sigma B factor antagonist